MSKDLTYYNIIQNELEKLGLDINTDNSSRKLYDLYNEQDNMLVDDFFIYKILEEKIGLKNLKVLSMDFYEGNSEENEDGGVNVLIQSSVVNPKTNEMEDIVTEFNFEWDFSGFGRECGWEINTHDVITLTEYRRKKLDYINQLNQDDELFDSLFMKVNQKIEERNLDKKIEAMKNN